MSTQRCAEKSAQAHGRERERASFGSSFYMFSFPLDLSYVNWASQECCLFYLRSPFWTPFPYSNYLTVFIS